MPRRLLAVAGLTAIRNHPRQKLVRRVGAFCFLFAVPWTGWEAVTGKLNDPVSAAIMFFHPASQSTDLVALPVTICHIGGVIGATLAFFIFNAQDKWCCTQGGGKRK